MRVAGAGEVVDLDGLRVANARQPWFLMNAALLTEPVLSQTHQARAHAAMEYFGLEHRLWFRWQPAMAGRWRPRNAGTLWSHTGVHRVGMVAAQLAAPARPLPEVETRRIDDESGRLALADLNAAVYAISSEWCGAVAGESLWQSPLYGYVAYVDGVPVSTAFTVPLHGVLDVGFVATALAHRRRGSGRTRHAPQLGG